MKRTAPEQKAPSLPLSLPLKRVQPANVPLPVKRSRESEEEQKSHQQQQSTKHFRQADQQNSFSEEKKLQSPQKPQASNQQESSSSSSSSPPVVDKILIQARRLEDFCMDDVAVSIQNDSLKIHYDGKPIFIDIEPNGYLPKKIGVNRFARNKKGIQTDNDPIIIKVNVENPAVREQFGRISQDCDDFLTKYPLWQNLERGRMHEKIFSASFLYEKEGSNYLPLFSATTTVQELKRKQCSVINARTNLPFETASIFDLKGLKCSRLRFEFAGWNLWEPEKGKLQASPIRLLRKIYVDPEDVEPEYGNHGSPFEFVPPEYAEKHASSGCTRPHAVLTPVSDFVFGQSASLLPMSDPPTAKKPTGGKGQQKQQFFTRTARVTILDQTTPLHLDFQGGGRFLDQFGVTTSDLHGTTKVHFTISSMFEVRALESMHQFLEEKCVAERSNWFPFAYSAVPDVIRSYAKHFIDPQRRKYPKDMPEDEKEKLMCTPIADGDPVWPRALGCQIDLEKITLKEDAEVFVFDGAGRPLSAQELPSIMGKNWDRIVIEVKNVYLKKTDATSYSAAFSARVVYIRLSEEYDSSHYEVVDPQ